MTIWDRMKAFLRRRAPAIAVGVATRQIAPERKLPDYLAAYTYWVFACVRTIAENVAEVPLRLYYVKGDGSEEELSEHVLLDLLSQVNPWMTEFELRELTQVHLELAGEAWWTLEPNRLGVPQEIWPLANPAYVHIVPDRQDFIGRVEYRPPGVEPISFAPNEVIQFKYTHPTNLYRGWSPTRAAAMPVDVHTFAMEWVRDFFFNDATPGGVLTTEQQLQREQVQILREQWAEAHRGRGKAHRIAVLGQGAKFQTVERSLSELAFTDEQKRLRDDILAIYGVPKHIVGITEDVNRANAEAAEYVFAKRVVAPRLRRLEGRLNEFLVPRFDERLRLRFDDPVPENRELRLKERETGVRAGWLTINEARAEEGRPSLGPKFDVPWLPATLFPADNLGGEAEPGKAVRPAARRVRLTEGQREAFWKAWVRQTEPHEGRMVRQLKKFFQWEQDQVMDRLRELGPEQQSALEALAKRRAVNPDVFLWDAEEAAERLERLGLTILVPVIAQAGEAVMSQLQVDVTFDVEHPAVQTRLRDQLQRVKGIDETTREAVRQELLEGLDGGESIPQLAERISRVFAQAKGPRALTIARTEVNGAAALGAVEAYRQSGVVKGKEWVAALDERTRDAHVAADGQVVPLDARFRVGGEMLDYPGDPSASAGNVVNCRCAVAPAVAKP